MNAIEWKKQTIKNCPQLMTTIINIQMMEQKIGNGETPFKVLEKMNGEELFNRVDELVPLYNKAVKF